MFVVNKANFCTKIDPEIGFYSLPPRQTFYDRRKAER